MPELYLLWEVAALVSDATLWADLKINIHMLPGNWDSSHS